VDDLESFFRGNVSNLQVLGEIRGELRFRQTDRARQLLKEVEGVLAGAVPLGPKPQRADRADDQTDLLAD
jgi:hypothetical protein